jgi:hypothetical protein
MLHMPKQAFASFLAYEEAPISALSPIERQVVYLSLADDRRSAVEETRIRRFWRALFGQRGPNRLADPKLEALRVFCVLYRHDRSVITHKPSVSGGTGHLLDPAIMSAAAGVIDLAVSRSA